MHTANNEILEFGDEFLNHLKEKEAWSKLSEDEEFKWTMEFVEKYADKIDWAKLSENRKVIWDIETLEKFKSKVDWVELSRSFFYDHSRFYHSQNCAKKIPNKEIFLEKFSKYWDWSEVSHHLNDINENLIDQFIHKWDWSRLIDNKEMDWTPEKFKKYQRYIPISKIRDFTDSALWEQLVDYKLAKLKAKLLLES